MEPEWMLFGYEGRTVMLTKEEYKIYEDLKYEHRMAGSNYNRTLYYNRALKILERGMVRHQSKDYVIKKVPE